MTMSFLIETPRWPFVAFRIKSKLLHATMGQVDVHAEDLGTSEQNVITIIFNLPRRVYYGCNT